MMNNITALISINDKTAWVRVGDVNGSVEGKIHSPKHSNKKLIIFEPGFPGDGSTRLERLWLDTLIKSNFTIFAIRHSGTIINGPYAAVYLNCPERQDLAREHNERLLGGKDFYTITDWLIEPYIALKTFTKEFDEIYLVGHSFGGLAIFYSLIKFANNQPDLAKKVKRILSLAGTTGRVESDDNPIIRQWSDYLRRDSTKERIDIGDPDQNLKTLKGAYRKIHAEANLIPESTEIICVMVEQDELVSPGEAKDIIKTLGRGYFILDRGEKADKNSGRLAHDMDNLKAATFLNLVSYNWKPKETISIL